MMKKVWKQVLATVCVLALCVGFLPALGLPTAKAAASHTIWIVGDSTACHYGDTDDAKLYYKRGGFGDYLANYLADGTYEVQNLALSGRSSKSFLSENNYKNTLKSGIAAGDVLVIAFGHNDEKSDDSTRFTDPKGDWQTEGSFAKSLYDNYVKLATDKNATPILCTPIVRYVPGTTWTDNALHVTAAGDYPAAIRKLAEDKSVALVDLTNLTKELYTELGPEESVNLHSWTANKSTSADATHLNKYGANVVAQLLAQGIAATSTDVASHINATKVTPNKGNELVANPDYKAADFSNLPDSTKWTKYTCTAKDGTSLTFKGTAFGDLGGDKANTTNFTIAPDGNGGAQIAVKNGNGKISDASASSTARDGLAMYYYRLNRADVASFTFTAKAKVNGFGNKGSFSSQCAFGLMARDDMYIDTNDSSIISDYVVAGTLYSSGGGTNCFMRKDGVLGGTGTSAPGLSDLQKTTIEVGKTYDLSISFNGEGFTCQIGEEEPVSGGYDFLLYSEDSDHMYIGMFAARGFDVTFSDIDLVVTSPAGSGSSSGSGTGGTGGSGGSSTVVGTYVFESKDLPDVAETATDKPSNPSSIDEHFTIHWNVKGKTESRAGSWSASDWGEGTTYSSSKPYATAATGTTEDASLEFSTTQDTSKVSIWWKRRRLENNLHILNEQGEVEAKTSLATIGAEYEDTYSELEVGPGRHFLGSTDRTTYIYKVVVADGGTVDPTVVTTYNVSGSLKTPNAGMTALETLTADVTALSFVDGKGNTYEADVDNTAHTYTASVPAGGLSVVATVSGYAPAAPVNVTGAGTYDVVFAAPKDTSAVAYAADIYVGDATKGDVNFATVQAAVDYASRMTRTAGQRVTVHIAPGTYREQIIINTPDLTFVNTDDTGAQKVILTWYYGIGYIYYSAKGGYYDPISALTKAEKGAVAKWGVAVYLQSKASGFLAENITFENSFNRYVTDEEIADGVYAPGVKGAYYSDTDISYDRTQANADVRRKGKDSKDTSNATERAAALVIESENCEFFQCSFLSSQDTIDTNGKAYFKDCFIEGQTDYIFGKGEVVFDDCILSWKGYSANANGGYITAKRPRVDPAANATGHEDYGYLFRNCTITSKNSESLSVAAGQFGRPWRATASVIFLDTTIEKTGLITDAAWGSMSGVNPSQAYFREYNTKYANGESVSTSKRAEGTGTLTATEAAAIDPTNYFGDWEPVHYDDGKVHKKALNEAISAAEEALAAIPVDTDAANIPEGDNWILAADQATYDAAIKAAKAVANNASATQEEVDEAVTTLAAATTAFQAAQKKGTKCALSLSADKVSVSAGKSSDLTATVVGYVGKTLAAVSEDTDIATVKVANKTVTVTGVAVGSANVYVVMADAATVTVDDAQANASVIVVPVTVTAKSSSVGGASRPTDRNETTTPSTGTETGTGTEATTPAAPAGADTVEAVKTETAVKADGTKVTTTEMSDGSEVVKEVTLDGDVAVEVTTEDGEKIIDIEVPADIPASETKFVDVADDHWAAAAIDRMASLGLVKGTGSDNYSPDGEVTRATLATMLFRFANGAEGKENKFADVQGHWAADAIAWAAEAGVVNGISADAFAPDAEITREQMAVMLLRFAKLIGMDTTVDASAAMGGYVDNGQVGSWAADGMAWCVKNGIINGTTTTTLSPTNGASRAQTAVMLDRFIGLLSK